MTGYEDSFETALRADDPRTAGELVRAGLEGAPWVVRRVVPLIQRWVMGLRLGPLDAADHVLGWRIASSEPERVVLRADSPLVRATLTGWRSEGSVGIVTTLDYLRPTLARAVWTFVGPVHRRVAPLLLDRAASAGPPSSLRSVSLSAGPVEYADTGGPGPLVVLVNAALTDHTLWSGVVERLADRCRCVSVVLPLGGHRRPMRRGADLSLVGQARLLAELLEALDLRSATVCFNDWSGAQVLLARGWHERVGRLVLISCETSGNYPPGLPGRFLGLLGRVPGGLWLGYKAMRLPGSQRLPFTFGAMTRRPLPRSTVRRWFGAGQRDGGVRRDLQAYVSGVPQAKRDLVAADARLADFDRPVLVVWGAEDRVMPRAEGERLAAAFPLGTFVTVPDSATLVPLDQPERLAELIGAFVTR